MLTKDAETRLAENPDAFTRAVIEVVLESSPDTPTGVVAFDDRGRWISVEPEQVLAAGDAASRGADLSAHRAAVERLRNLAAAYRREAAEHAADLGGVVGAVIARHHRRLADAQAIDAALGELARPS